MDILTLIDAANSKDGTGLPAVPERFTEFAVMCGAEWETNGQRILCEIAFDGTNPGDYEGEERGTARELFGSIDTIPESVRGVLVAVCGARGGKTYLLGALRVLHLSLLVSLESMAHGQKATGLIVAPDLRLAQECLDYVKGVLDETPFGAYEDKGNRTNEHVALLRPKPGKRGKMQRVWIQCLPATSGGKALRGRSLTAAFLDECAFFQDSSYKVNDEEVFKAVAPRVLPGGQAVLASTPWGELGLLFDLFKANHGQPDTAMAVRAKTLTLRAAPWVVEIVEREYRRDPINAAREYGAQFMGVGTEQFFDPRSVDAARDSSIEWGKGLPSYAGGDLGFVRDSAALALAQHAYEAIIITKLVELTPHEEPLKPSVVIKRFMAEIVDHGADGMAADSHYRETVREHFEDEERKTKLRFKLLPEGQQGKVEQYLLASQLLAEGRLKLPDDEKLISQFKAVLKRILSGGRISIQSPRRANSGHGDLVSAVVAAVWHAYGRNRGMKWQRPDVPPEPGSAEAQDLEAAREKAKVLAAIKKRNIEREQKKARGYFGR